LHANILVTNDDGYNSYGIRALAKMLRDIGNIIVVCPDRPRSASGFSLTLQDPIRVKSKVFDGIRYYLVSGTPGDCVALGLFHLLDKRPDLVVSGINIGENVSLLEFFMSGTLAGAIAASLYGVPAIALSKVIPDKDVMIVEEVRDDMDLAAKVSKELIKYLIDRGFPEDADIISINFPARITKDTQIRFTRIARLSLSVKIYERDDPRGTPYYWIWGEKFGNFPELTDAKETLINGNISITPIRLEDISIYNPKFKTWEKDINDIIRGVLDGK